MQDCSRACGPMIDGCNSTHSKFELWAGRATFAQTHPDACNHVDAAWCYMAFALIVLCVRTFCACTPTWPMASTFATTLPGRTPQ
eukprot:6439346-Alexandrium_andersonii.AAC.1